METVSASTKISTTEMHTGGEPLRVIDKDSGFPPIKGNTLLEKRRYIKEHLDCYRKLLMFEPRGHYDMYGVLLVSPDMNDADIGAIFMHNEGYSTMCGHAVIALGRYAVDKGLVKKTCPETKVNIQCPCGLVEAYVSFDGTKSSAVRFHSVPGFLFASGAFYALVPAKSLGLDMKTSKVKDLQEAAAAVTASLKKSLKLEHPDSADLAFLYGTIVTDGKDLYSEEITDNICVFADEEVDRSPCGSGVTARIAQQYHRNLIQVNQTRTFRGPAGGIFQAKVVKQVQYGQHKSVIVEVSGNGYYTGTSTFTVEEDDKIGGAGFLLK
ncbi:hypothetical protein KUTeg_013672 [Tegillarca granosa]|uniref:trans-L-3-hydroxyproline dehydratase n=1 Tax=Tegillarca granosa TaxID=220873 RepID=A0ABQ9EUD5_TEGGR|nr:hypothetical protein KUTeg_013672 [Tegillarca granosa]